MANKIVTSMGRTRIPFEFADADGEIFASFKLNPADARLIEKLESFNAKMLELQSQCEASTDGYEKVLTFTKGIEDLFCELMGYDVHECLFGRISATAEDENGVPFYMIILDAIGEQGSKEVEKRTKNVEKAIKKYTDKYTK